MDPRHGELSPAMRNRGVEIYLADVSGNNVDYHKSTTTFLSPSITQDSGLLIEELAYYSHASVATKQYHLMEKMAKVRNSSNHM